MNISILAAGSGGMYCGSCMRDNALAGALRRKGHAVTLIPLYTPLRTEGDGTANGTGDGDGDEVFYGGINVYLQHASAVFRHTPRALDWLLDRAGLLNLAGRIGAQASPAKLGGLTLSIVRGEDGPAIKELARLARFLKDDVRPQIVSLPNLMFIGTASVLRRELGVPVVCELTGEDIFLDAMTPADQVLVRDAIRRRAGDVDRFVATSDFYAGRMAEYLDIPKEQIDVVYPGVPAEYLTEPPRATRSADAGGPPTVGYLARMCPEKGIDRLIDAMLLLQQMPGMRDVRLEAAGYVGSRDAAFYQAQQDRVARSPLAGQVTFHGEVDREQKLRLLDAVDVFAAPTAYAEAKGIFVLEALARGLPVVQPAHGAFPELVNKTAGGALVAPGNAGALATALAQMLGDASRRRAAGEAGRAAVAASFTDDAMAEGMLAAYEHVIGATRDGMRSAMIATEA